MRLCGGRSKSSRGPDAARRPPVGIADRYRCCLNRSTEGGEVVSLTSRPRSIPQKHVLVLVSVKGWVNARDIVRLECLGKLKKKIKDRIGTQTRDIPACSIVLQTNYATACPTLRYHTEI
jgi:hypothetical protein